MARILQFLTFGYLYSARRAEIRIQALSLLRSQRLGTRGQGPLEMAPSWSRATLALVLLATFSNGAEHTVCNPADAVGNGVFSPSDFERCMQVNFEEVGSVLFYWRWVGGAEGKVTVALQFPTDQGWVSFGLSEGGSMYGADQWIFQQKEGQWDVQDYHSFEKGFPILDDDQDVTLLGAESAGGKTFVMAERAAHTCHSAKGTHDLKFLEATMPFLFAWGDSRTLSYHGANRGTAWINPASDVLVQELPSDVQTVEIRSPKLSVPTDDRTQYCYSSHRLPSDSKYHLVRAEPKLVSNHPERVHHMILYACADELSDEEVARPVTCNGDGMKGSCLTFWTLWAVGGQPLELPQSVGMPFGEKGRIVSPTSVILEIHYENPENLSIEDESGFKLFYTSTLRENDASVLTLGHVGIRLPAGSSSTELRNECPGECTKKMDRPFTVLSAGLHMHQAGKKIWTQHIRGDTELEPLGERHSWDFNMQNPTPVGRVVEPGDRLITYCEYDTSSRTRTTRFGERSEDEMCFNFLLVYPAPNLLACVQLTNGATNKEMNTAVCLDEDSARTFLEDPFSDLAQVVGATVSIEDDSNINLAKFEDEACRMRLGAATAENPASLASSLLLAVLVSVWAFAVHHEEL